MTRAGAWLLAIAVAGCAAGPLALLPVTPLLATALASRGGDDQAAKLIAELEAKQDWAGLSALAARHLKLDPSDTDWWVIFGYARLRDKDYQQAIEVFSRLVDRAPEDTDARNLLGEALRLSGRPGRAVQVLERAVTISPSSPASWFLLGEAYRDDRRLERAKAAYLDAVRLEPAFSPAWLGLAKVLARTGPREEYEEAVKRLQALDPAMAQELGAPVAR